MTTKINENLYKELNNKRKEYKKIIKNSSVRKHNELLLIERELYSIINEIKQEKQRLKNKDDYTMKNLKL